MLCQTKLTIGKWSSLLIHQQQLSHDQNKDKNGNILKWIINEFLNLFLKCFFTVKILSVSFLLTHPVHVYVNMSWSLPCRLHWHTHTHTQTHTDRHSNVLKSYIYIYMDTGHTTGLLPAKRCLNHMHGNLGRRLSFHTVHVLYRPYIAQQ